MITKEQVLEAIELLNAAEIGIKIKTARAKEEDLRENFLATVDELLEAKKQKSIPEKVAVIYNALVEEENEKAEEVEATKEKKEKAPKEKKEKAVKAPKEKTEGKKESRPQALKRKMETIPELEDLLNDKELLTIYNGRKAWIRNDFNKLLKK